MYQKRFWFNIITTLECHKVCAIYKKNQIQLQLTEISVSIGPAYKYNTGEIFRLRTDYSNIHTYIGPRHRDFCRKQNRNESSDHTLSKLHITDIQLERGCAKGVKFAHRKALRVSAIAILL